MSKRTKTFDELVALINSGEVIEENRCSKAGVSVYTFNELAVKRGYTTMFYLNQPAGDGTCSINNYQVRGVNTTLGKRVIIPVELTASDCGLQADTNIFLLDSDRQNALLNAMDEGGWTYDHTGKIRGTGGDRGKCRIYCKTLDEFFDIADYVCRIEELVAKSVYGPKFDLSTNNKWGMPYDNRCRRRAYGFVYDSLCSAVKRGYTTALSRGVGVFDDFKHQIIIGCSKKYLDGRIVVKETWNILEDILYQANQQGKSRARYWGEHLVPCDYQIRHYISMILGGASEEDVLDQMEYANKIVILTHKEAIKLDSKWKTEMPAGWRWGDPIDARLQAAGIKWEKVPHDFIE